MANAVGEGDEEGDPYGTGDAGTMGEVETGEVGDDASDRAITRQPELGENGHDLEPGLERRRWPLRRGSRDV